MSWFKRSQNSGITLNSNRGTGEFIDNINWWFWNGKAFPGLITREQFGRIRQRCLTSEEDRELSKMLVQSSIVTHGKKHIDPALGAMMNKLSRFLEKLTSDDEDSTKVEFLENPFDALKAYINVLEFWGYRYSWYPVSDVWGEETIILSKADRPVVTVKKSDVQYIQGRPFRFQVGYKSLTWNFDETQEDIFASQRSPVGGEVLTVKRKLV